MTSQVGSSWRSATPAQRAYRKSYNFHGPGMYTGGGLYTGRGGFWKSLGRGMRKLGKSKLVRGIRHDISRDIGAVADTIVPGAGMVTNQALKAAGVGMYTGSGSYGPVKNDLIAGGHGTQGVMRFDQQTDEESITISHSEFVMDVYAPAVVGSSQDTKLSLNAGLSYTFPMLSQIAANFEEAEIMQLAFTYKPTLSDWQTSNGQVGSIMFATNHNPNANLWTTKEQILAVTGSTSSKVTEPVFHGIECDPSKHHNDQQFLVRTGPAPLQANLTDYDLGWMQMRVRDVPVSNLTLGELHVSYTVKLRRPRIYSGIGSAISSYQGLGFKQDPAGIPGYCVDQDCSVAQEWSSGSWVNPSAGDNSVMLVPSEVFGETVVARQSAFRPLIRLETDKYIGSGEASPGITTAMAKIKSASDSGQLNAETHPSFKGVNTLTFPASMQGTYEVELTLHGRDMFRSTTPDKSQAVYLGVGGNVELVQDLTEIKPAQWGDNENPLKLGPTQMTAQIVALSPANSTFVVKCHVRVKTASSGIDNQVGFQFIHGSLDTTVTGIARWCEVKIREYNSTLSYKPDGTDDRIIYVNPTSGALLNYP